MLAWRLTHTHRVFEFLTADATTRLLVVSLDGAKLFEGQLKLQKAQPSLQFEPLAFSALLLCKFFCRLLIERKRVEATHSPRFAQG